MADYQLTQSSDTVLRTADQAWIPNDPGNRDWIEYQNWLTEGGVPDPYVPPIPPGPAPPSPEEALLFDHENRLRALEGAPVVGLEDFIGALRGG